MERLSSEMGGEMRKGPWTSEEDLVLSTFVQENGPGNWTSIPMITGLNRCGKSCRLRWMNHLRPGIKRGNFTPEEDRKIVQLQAILGNKDFCIHLWASIAHYLPGRTNNDIKNYWNSNLKEEVDDPHSDDGWHNAGSSGNTTTGVLDQDSDSDSSKRRWERMLQENVHLARKALSDALSFSPQAAILDRDDLSLSPPAYAPILDASLPLIAPGLSSPLPMAAPQLSSGCMSFKPPHGWNQTTSQQHLMIPTDKHQFRGQAAGQITWASAPGLSSPLPMAAPLLSSGCMSFKPPRGWNQKTSHQQLMIPADDHQSRRQAAGQITRASAPGLSSPLPIAAPLLSSGCMSFKPPHGWNQKTSHQQLLIPADDHQSRSQAASQITWVSNCSTTTEPYVFNCENIAIWLERWNRET